MMLKLANVTANDKAAVAWVLNQWHLDELDRLYADLGQNPENYVFNGAITTESRYWPMIGTLPPELRAEVIAADYDWHLITGRLNYAGTVCLLGKTIPYGDYVSALKIFNEPGGAEVFRELVGGLIADRRALGEAGLQGTCLRKEAQ